MKICIGIISYLPDSDSRDIRQKKLLQLIDTCNRFFNLPILIVAQNGKDMSIINYRSIYNVSNCGIYHYQKPLGIVGARNELRRIFLSSNYDYLIMLDDDSVVTCTQEGVDEYIKQIESHPNMYGTFNSTLLKLFAISKEMFSKLDFGSGKVEDGDYFEDILFVNTLKKKYPTKEFIFSKKGINERSNNYNDPASTGYYGQYDKHNIGDNTRALLKEL